MKDQARVVVIGGGITGCCVLYHLAMAGWTDIVLIEKGELTSGATCQAAGMLTQFNTSPTMMRIRKYSVEMYGRLNAYEKVGSLRIASSKEQFKTLQREVSQAKALGLTAETISPKETLDLMPWMSDKNLYGGLYLADDGHLDPHGATLAVAKAATDLGATIYTHTRVTGIELSPKGDVSQVLTDKGNIQCETVVNAAGIWGAQVASMAGVHIPSTPVIHQHAALTAVPGHEISGDSPCFRDTDYLIYGRPEGGSYLFGGWEPNPAVCWIDGVPWEHSASEVSNDFEQFEPLMENAIERYPFLADAGLVRLVAHPDAFSPDSKPIIGPWPGVRGFWLACAASMNGFGGAGGIGKAIAEWIIEGETEIDVHSYRAWRFGKNYNVPGYAAECARECYKYYYRTRYPNDEDESARPRRTSPFYHRLQDLGAVFGKKNGWERPLYFMPGKPWRRAGEDQREWGGWVRPAYFHIVGEEHKAFRERVGLIDLSSFGKIDVKGTGSLPLLQRLSANNIDRPAGTVIYTQFLNRSGGMVSDVIITRLGENHFRMITGSGSIDHDLGWVRLNLQATDPPVEICNVTEDYAAIGMWGPKARQVLERIIEDDISNEALPYMAAKIIIIHGIEVLIQRISYVGESGWEFYPATDKAIFVWDRLWAAGQEFGMAACGYKSVDSLRLEKGYCAFGGDLTMLENPYEAGLGFCVNLNDGGDFTGRDALRKVKKTGINQRLSTLIIGGEDYLPIYGGEAVISNDKVIGRLRSAGYGYTVKKNIGYVYLPLELAPPDTPLEIELFGERVAARVAERVLIDPDGKRLRQIECR